MTTFLIVIFVIVAVLILLIWLRKVQFDAVHRNFLDLVDNFGGKVHRGGFAIRPRYSGNFKEFPVSISISSEKKEKNQNRLFYISIYYKAEGNHNFTVLSNDWLTERDPAEKSKRPFRLILKEKYRLEVAKDDILKKIDITSLEKIIETIDPIAYALVSQKGIILERISTNLIKDTEFDRLNTLLEGLCRLKNLT
jgi:hypothetical protein